MEKDYVVHPSSSILEFADLMAEEIGRQEGFSVNSKEYMRVRKKIIDECLKHSVFPEAGASLEKNPRISDTVTARSMFDVDKIIRNSESSEEKADKYIRELRGAVTKITHIYLEAIAGLKVKGDFRQGSSSFEFKKDKGQDEESVRQVIEDRYVRIFVYASIMAAIAPIFNIDDKTLETFLIRSGIRSESIKTLRSRKYDESFMNNLGKALRGVFNTDILKENIGSGVEKEITKAYQK